MGPKTQLLVSTLDELVPLLRQHGEAGWAARFEEDARMLREGSGAGLGTLNSDRGRTCGSFYDCCWNTACADERVRELYDRASELADEIMRVAVFE